MGFKIINPADGRIATRGRKALECTVRLHPINRNNCIRFTISGDLLAAYQLTPGDRVNVMLGTDEDHGRLVILKTTPRDDQGYTIYSPGAKAKIGCFNIVASKIYGLSLKKPVDLIVSKSASRGLMVTFPASILSPAQPTLRANGSLATEQHI